MRDCRRGPDRDWHLDLPEDQEVRPRKEATRDANAKSQLVK